ncbi:uncharacterized protein LOC134266408 [Saccostrea cucullata]|uniref:uncharacterized protein LOC134266408 n=1 Tax=Saccostrea cuccullata TaxID=36930 RepID=UPI002ED552C4
MMRSLKVLLVLLSLFCVSLSRELDSGDDLRAVLRKLERLLSREITGTNPTPGPDGETDKGLSGVFNTILEPYFGSFPSGNFQFTELSLTREEFVKIANEWYTTTLSRDSSELQQKAFSNMTSVLLEAIFKCPTAKINQMVFYVLKDRERAMTEGDRNMYDYVKKILENQITNDITRESVARMIVKDAHRHMFGDFMKYIKFFYFKDIMEFFGKMKTLLYEARKDELSVSEFDQKLNELLTSESKFDFKCPRLQHLWDFHQALAVRFQQKFSEDKHLGEARTTMTKYLAGYLTSDPTPVVSAILRVYSKYVKGAVRNFERVETHMTTRNMDDIINFVSEFLNEEQLQYLKSIFEYLKVTESGRNIGSRGMGSSSDWDDIIEPDSGFGGDENTEPFP